MSEKAKIEEIASSDDETYEDAETNKEIVDEILKKQFSSVSINNLKTPENENEIKPDKDDDNEKFIDCIDEIVDDEGQRELELSLTEEQKLENKEKAEVLKKEANEFFKNQDYEKAVEIYTNALRMCPVDYGNERSILYGNRAAAKIQLESKNAAIEDCTKSLEFNPNYMKALLRRAKLYEETDKLDESLEDYKKIVEIDPGNTEGRQAMIRLPPQIQERNEKMKEEMMGKLKDLGNMILKPFGLSTNNFQMQQDPNTGSYSINFNQK